MTRRAWIAAAAAGAAAARAARLKDDGRAEVAFYDGSRHLFSYRYGADRPKTYVHPLKAPDGTVVSLDGPEDHVHHRGLMLAWSAINGFDFWGETNPGRHGQIVHEGWGSRGDRRLASRLRWEAEGAVLLREQRMLAAVRSPQPVNLLDWDSELTAETTVLLSAGKHPYNGLGIRVAPSMDFGEVINSAGTTDFNKASGEPALWCAYHGKAPGGLAGVGIFNHPANPRHPSPFFVMNDKFGYLSAAPTFTDSFPLEKGESIRFRWRVGAWRGAWTRQEIDRLYQEWTREG